MYQEYTVENDRGNSHHAQATTAHIQPLEKRRGV